MPSLKATFAKPSPTALKALSSSRQTVRYQPGKRGWLWIKFKREYQKQLADTFDLVIVGAIRGKGSRAGSYGSLLLASFDPAANKYYSLTKVGAGFSDTLLRRLPRFSSPTLFGRNIGC